MVLIIIGVSPSFHLNHNDRWLNSREVTRLNYNLYSLLAAATTPLAAVILTTAINVNIRPGFPKRSNHCHLIKIADRHCPEYVRDVQRINSRVSNRRF